MSEPLISIIVPTLNSEKYIGAALDSLLAQTYKNIQIVVVDGRSNDRTEEIVASFSKRDPRIRFLYQKDKGPAEARNEGLATAGGSYVTFFDSDNLLMPEACASVADKIKEGGNHDVYYGDLRYFNTEDPQKLLKFTLHYVPEVTLETILEHNFINLLGTFIKKETFERAGGFDNRFRTCEEHILWFRLLLRASARFSYIDKVLGHLRFHATNLTWRASYFVEAAETNFVIYDWLEQEFTKRLPEERRGPIIKKLEAERAKWLFRAGLGGLIMKDRRVAIDYFGRWVSFARKPAFVKGLLRAGVFLAPLSFVSPLFSYLRRRAVMKKYVVS